MKIATILVKIFGRKSKKKEKKSSKTGQDRKTLISAFT